MELVKVANLDDLVLPQDGTVDLPRGDDVYSLPIRALTTKEVQAIAKEHQPPNAPKMWRPESGPGSKMIQYANFDDPAYVAEVDKANEDKVKATILLGLKVTIPGSSLEEKWEALSTHIVGNEWMAIFKGINELSNALGRVAEEAKNFSPLPLTNEKTAG
jgi:hypothetical protein